MPWLPLWLGTVTWLAAASVGGAAKLYRIDQRHGTMEFSVRTLGLFVVQGRFPRFEGDLLLDLDQPERSHFEVFIDASAVEMPAAGPDRPAALGAILRHGPPPDAALREHLDPGTLAVALCHTGPHSH